MRISGVSCFCLLFVVGTTISQFGIGHHWLRPWFYGQRNKMYYRLKKDPEQVKPPKVTPDNLFGWLNMKNAVKFYLWTRKNPDLAHELRYNDLNSFNTSNFDSKRLTKIIIHGWADGASEVQIGDWMIFMRDAYLKFADVNYIVVDYAVYASWFMYYSAIPELVAERLTEMIKLMEKQGFVQYDSLHIVGWSWGSHVAGMAGHRLKGRIGRITAIDPAGPTFRFTTDEFRIDKSDAVFVDVIHVNGGFPSSWGYFGLEQPLGHVDFYPSGGGTQIGCPQRKTLIYETLWCSHGRGVKYFTESIYSPLSFPSCRCENFDKYVKGECSCNEEDIAYMGEHISHKTIEGIYQLVTRPKPLYGHGIPLNVSLPNIVQETLNGKENNASDVIVIRHKDLSVEKVFINTYIPESYPNDDILKICKDFVHNLTKTSD